ncbi:Protein of unknown function [Bacillus toyonensis]|nr:Protein of unknown function [Bacillus wiedmannii]SCN20541.1 Protein of unknown function [Bacillus toyonensis]SCV18440.1 Protein of unknown function [Bacillus cereus]
MEISFMAGMTNPVLACV